MSNRTRGISSSLHEVVASFSQVPRTIPDKGRVSYELVKFFASSLVENDNRSRVLFLVYAGSKKRAAHNAALCKSERVSSYLFNQPRARVCSSDTLDAVMRATA